MDNTSTNAILNWTSNKTQKEDQLIKDYKDRTLTLYGKYKPKMVEQLLIYLRRYQDFHRKNCRLQCYGTKRDTYWYLLKQHWLTEILYVPMFLPGCKQCSKYVKNLDDYFYHYRCWKS